MKTVSRCCIDPLRSPGLSECGPERSKTSYREPRPQVEARVPADYHRHCLDAWASGMRVDGLWTRFNTSKTKKRGQRARRKRHEELLTKHSSDTVQRSLQKRGGC